MKRVALASVLGIILLASAPVAADNMPFAASGAFTAGANEAIVILNQLGLYVENAGTLAFKEGLIIGDKLQVTGGLRKFKVDKAEREYLRVKAPSGQEGWVRSPYALSKVALAVVKEGGAMVYNQPRDVSVTAQTISPMTIVAVFQDGGTPQFSKVNCYDVAQNIYYTESDKVFVPREDLTFADVDINAVIIYATALSAKNKDVRANLYKVIERKYSSSIFFEAIKAAIAPAAPAAAPAAAPVAGGRATAPANGLYIVNDDDVNLRAAPDELAGAVLGKVERGAQVEVVEKTVQTYTVAGQTAEWLKLKEPSGWVFGAFLTPVR